MNAASTVPRPAAVSSGRAVSAADAQHEPCAPASAFACRSLSPASRVIDLSRLVSRLHHTTPTGIDRVELAYARHYLEHATVGNVRFLVTTPLNTGLLSPGLAANIVRTALERWRMSDDDPGADAAYSNLREILQAPPEMVHARRLPEGSKKSPDIADKRAEALIGAAYAQAALTGAFDPRSKRLRDKSAWYLNVSHINLHRPRRLAWMRAAGVRGAFVLHDLIPVSHPEYCRPAEEARHRRRLEAMARLADIMIFNSRFTQSAWHAHLAALDLPRPAGAVVPLGIDDIFRDRKASPEPVGATPYFVMVGTIEARKNVAFLLQVWRAWTREGRRMPARLVIVGRRGWESENAVDLLDRSAALASSVIEVGDLGDAGLAALLRGARALLAPSLVEGFGLPLAEALALGIPVVASDIAAHREVGGNAADYVGPIDGPGWITALTELVKPDSRRRQDALARARLYRPASWSAHVEAVDAILSGMH